MRSRPVPTPLLLDTVLQPLGGPRREPWRRELDARHTTEPLERLETLDVIKSGAEKSSGGWTSEIVLVLVPPPRPRKANGSRTRTTMSTRSLPSANRTVFEPSPLFIRPRDAANNPA
jgi:hypothetical protein